MPVFQLDHRLIFPDPELAEESGLLAVGGDLSTERLMLAYQQGIFPWYEEGLPILWHSPDPRMILNASDVHVSRSLAKTIRKAPYEIRLDSSFRSVIEACAQRERPGQRGTWITEEMIDAYCELHTLGIAHCVEAWQDCTLVGGLYGVSVGAAFFGESMFSAASNASKIAFVTLCRQLSQWAMELVDCQVHTEHLESLGAREIPRETFLDRLHSAVARPTRRGPWSFGDP